MDAYSSLEKPPQCALRKYRYDLLCHPRPNIDPSRRTRLRSPNRLQEAESGDEREVGTQAGQASKATQQKAHELCPCMHASWSLHRLSSDARWCRSSTARPIAQVRKSAEESVLDRMSLACSAAESPVHCAPAVVFFCSSLCSSLRTV